MTWWMSPVDSDANVSAGAGGSIGGRPWWDYPTPLGPPKQQNGPGICYQERIGLNDEVYGAPVMCGPMWAVGGHTFTGTWIENWLQWWNGGG